MEEVFNICMLFSNAVYNFSKSYKYVYTQFQKISKIFLISIHLKKYSLPSSAIIADVTDIMYVAHTVSA